MYCDHSIEATVIPSVSEWNIFIGGILGVHSTPLQLVGEGGSKVLLWFVKKVGL